MQFLTGGIKALEEAGYNVDMESLWITTVLLQLAQYVMVINK